MNYNIFKGIFASEWVGLDVFRKVFNEDFFWTAMKNTVFLNLLVLFVKFPLSILLAILLNETKNRHFKRTSQSLLYLPYFVSWVTIAGIVTNLFSVTNGTVNNIIRGIGGSPIAFLSDNGWWTFVYVLSNTWKDVGWGTIIYLAALSGVDETLYEAAKIDGAGPLRIYFSIALPMAKPALVVTYLFSFIWIWNDTVQLPQYSTGAVTTLPMHLQQFAEQFNKLYSSVGVSTGGALNESIQLAGTLLSILPLIILYFLVQRSFIASIEKTGITGE
ncbi:MAG: ABC transporter permease subunit [Clostridia bacterium]|nr:ABC transporter permease subunit [Clostridia bacterium]